MPAAGDLIYSKDSIAKCDFAWNLLKTLPTVEVFNPNNRDYQLCIDQSHLYAGHSHREDPHKTIKQHPRTISGNPFELAHSRLKDALGDPGAPEDPQAWINAGVPDDSLIIKPKVDVPLNKWGGTLAAPEMFDEICRHPNYPYFRIDMASLRVFRRPLAQWLSGANLYEPCGGASDKMNELLRQISDYIATSHGTDLALPQRVIENDIEPFNLDRVTEEIKEKVTSIPVIGLLGDWMQQKTYINPKLKIENWTYYKGNVLKALRDDPARTVVYLPGAMANDFEQEELFAFLRDNFKPGTLFLILYDNTVDRKKLQSIYADHPRVQQLALTGLTHTCWEKLPFPPEFDPRMIGVEVKPVAWGEDSNIQISVFTKDKPDRRLHVTPIVKKGDHPHTAIVKKAGFEMVGRLRLPKHDRLAIANGADASLMAFTHQGYAEPFRRTLTDHYVSEIVPFLLVGRRRRATPQPSQT